MCDITKPEPTGSPTDRHLSAYQADLEKTARYEIRAGKYDEKVSIGRGYSWSVARRLQEVLDAACTEARPMENTWTKPLFSIHGIGPSFVAPEKAALGDIAIWRTTLKDETTSSGARVTVELFVTGYVSALSADGTPHRIRTQDGEEFPAPGKFTILPMAQFDGPAVIQELARRHERHLQEKLWGGPWGFFSAPQDVASALGRYLRHAPCSRPCASRAGRVIEECSVLAGRPPAKVDIDPLQQTLDAITKAGERATDSPLFCAF